MKRFFLLFIIISIFFNLKLPSFSQNEEIKVAFAIDNNYPVFTMIAIDSILQNNTSNSDYRFYILENNLSKFNQWQMKNFTKKRKQNIEFVHVDTTILDNGNNYYIYNGNNKIYDKKISHITRIASARLLLPTIFQNIDKILYLDGDIIVTGDLKDLWETNLFDNYAGMVFDTTSTTYFNDGIILFSLNNIRKNGLADIFINKFKNNPQYQFHDQDVLNFTLHQKIKVLPQNYNMQVRQEFPLSNKIPQQGIYHFIGKYKPWDFKKEVMGLKNYNEYENLYLSYWKKSYLKMYIPYYYIKSKFK